MKSKKKPDKRKPLRKRPELKSVDKPKGLAKKVKKSEKPEKDYPDVKNMKKGDLCTLGDLQVEKFISKQGPAFRIFQVVVNIEEITEANMRKAREDAAAKVSFIDQVQE